jgi:hypothetical protein
VRPVLILLIWLPSSGIPLDARRHRRTGAARSPPTSDGRGRTPNDVGGEASRARRRNGREVERGNVEATPGGGVGVASIEVLGDRRVEEGGRPVGRRSDIQLSVVARRSDGRSARA